jgi:iron complex outermembrane receptor protein
MRKWWLIIPCICALGWFTVDTALAREGKRVTAKELLRQGFFQDFEELDLETLLDFSDITLQIAARTEQVPDDAPGTVSIVTSDEIRAQGARTLEDVLRLVPGVDVTTDGLGRPQVAIRAVGSGATGGGSESVLILMNGQRMDEPIEGGATALNYLIPAGNIQKVEILRGPGSALFGSGAVAGVIDIVTFTQRDFTGIEATAGGGSFGTQHYALRLGSEGRALKLAGFLEFEDGNGARRIVGSDAQTGIDAALADRGIAPVSLAPGRSTDDRRLLETHYTATYLDWDFGIRVSNQRAAGLVGVAESLGDANDLIHRQMSISARNRRDLPRGWTLRTSFAFTRNDQQRTLQAFPPGFTQPTDDGGNVSYPSGVFVQEDLNSHRLGLEATAQKNIGEDHHLTAGLALGRESTSGNELKANFDFRSRSPLDSFRPLSGVVGDHARGIFSLFVQEAWSYSSKLSLTAGLRVDRYGDVGSEVSPRLGAVWRLPRGVKLKMLYGRAFRMPTLAELYFSLPGFIANPDLQPVTIDTLEVGLSWRKRRLRVSGGLFQGFERDSIVPEGTFVAGGSRRIRNGPGIDIRGVELEVRQGFDVGSSVFLNYSYQHPENIETGKRAADAATHIGSLGATFALASGARVTPALLFRSSRARAPGDLRDAVPGYALFNLTVRVPDVFKGLAVSLAIQNLFNKLYFDPSPAGGVPGDYPRPGRRAFLSATYQF